MAERVTIDTVPSPWLPCPRCAGVWVKICAVLERGTWDSDGETYTIDLTQPPRVGSFRSGPEDIECYNCGHKFSLREARGQDAEDEDDDD